MEDCLLKASLKKKRDARTTRAQNHSILSFSSVFVVKILSILLTVKLL